MDEPAMRVELAVRAQDLFDPSTIVERGGIARHRQRDEHHGRSNAVLAPAIPPGARTAKRG